MRYICLMFAVTPDWDGGSGYVRLLRAAWDAIGDVGHAGLKIRSLAAAAEVSPSLFHKYFRSLDDLRAEMAGAGHATLLANLSDEESLEDFANAWVRFAEACPRHYALMFAPRLSRHPNVLRRLSALADAIRDRVRPLGLDPDGPQLLTIWGVLHGAAALVVAGFPREPGPVLTAPLHAWFDQLTCKTACHSRSPAGCRGAPAEGP